jgi:hypothetical protein
METPGSNLTGIEDRGVSSGPRTRGGSGISPKPCGGRHSRNGVARKEGLKEEKQRNRRFVFPNPRAVA